MYIQPRLLLLLGLSTLSLLIALGILVLRTPSPEPIQILLPTPAGNAPPEIKVYVSGAVHTPGVYLFATGDRIEDALHAAGGPTKEADLERLNLARKLRDAEQILVPRRGEAVPAGSVAAPRVNINVASQAELDALPGIGPVRSQRIMDSRTKDGAFTQSYDLVERKIVPQSVYEQIKDLITVN